VAGGFIGSKNLPVKRPVEPPQAGRKSRAEPDRQRREEETSIELDEEDGAARREQNQLGGFTSYSE
jgi:hypothetical protein